jgi:ribose 5-phosphate isomerase B
MKILLGSDHAGFPLKEHLKTYLGEKGYQVHDVGCYNLHPVDYPDVALEVAQGVRNGEAERGVLVCGTGIGMDIAANKVQGVRAARVTDTISANLARAHNDTKVLCLGNWLVAPMLGEKILDVWLNTTYEGDKHISRLEKIARIDGQTL